MQASALQAPRPQLTHICRLSLHSTVQSPTPQLTFPLPAPVTVQPPVPQLICASGPWTSTVHVPVLQVTMHGPSLQMTEQLEVEQSTSHPSAGHSRTQSAVGSHESWGRSGVASDSRSQSSRQPGAAANTSPAKA